MISASSSSTLRAARKFITEPLICFEPRRTWVTSLGHQQRRGYNTEGPASDKPRRQSSQPIPTTTQLKPPNSKVNANLSGDDSERPKRLLEPYVLSRRLTNLTSQGRFDEAVDMLRTSPLDASNVVTWNTLMLHCMREKRFKLGYKLFTHMKRRGFKPNIRTYNVLLSGLSRIKNWEEHSVQFKNAQALWQSYLRRVGSLKKFDPKHHEITSNPAAFYISILTSNKDYNAMFDVLNDLDEEGPFAPSEFIYTKIMRGIHYREQLAPGDKESVAYRNASDAKLVWKELTKRAVKNPDLVSSHVILYFLRAMMKGRPADHLFAFDVVRDYLGLSKPGEEAPPRRIEVTPMTLDTVLQLCLATHKYRLCIHYVQQMIDEAIANNRKAIVDYRHMEKVLRSYAGMTVAGSIGESDRAVETIEWMHRYRALGWDVKPRKNAYGWGLMSCWRGGDWANAARIMELMTGCHAEAFVDGSRTPPLQRSDRTRARGLVPDARDMSCLLRAALASGDVANMRQCLRMATFFGGLQSSSDTKHMDAYIAHGQPPENTPKSAISKREELFYSTKVTSSFADVLTRVLEGTDPAVDTPEMKRWRGLKERAGRTVQESTKPGFMTPDSELELFDSTWSLEATERSVNYDLATRSRH